MPKASAATPAKATTRPAMPTSTAPGSDRAERRRGTSAPLSSGRRATDSSWLASAAVSFRVGRLEPVLAWALAACTLWTNIVYGVSGMAFWLMAFFAASVGGWSSMFPARRQLILFIRAALLLLGGLFLQVEAGTGAAVGPYAFWPAVVGIFYALLLAAPWAVALVMLVMSQFALACWLTLAAVPWQPVLFYAGCLLAIAPLAIFFGLSLRASDDSAESNLKDERTSLYNEAGFFMHGSVLMAQCQRRDRPFSMVLLNGADLLEIPSLLGRKVANDLFEQVVRGISKVSGEGIAARIDAVEFGLLLPGVGTERATAMVRQILGDPPKVEVKVDGKGAAEAKPIVIVLDMAVAQARDKSQTLEALYDELHARWTLRNKPGISTGKAEAKVPVLGPDDERFAGHQRVAGPTVPMPLREQVRPWDK